MKSKFFVIANAAFLLRTFLLFASIVVIAPRNVLAQQTQLISGKVINNSGQGIDKVTVNVLRKDSVLLYTGLSTDTSGGFQIRVAKDGVYILKFEKTGFETKLSTKVNIDGRNLHYRLGDLVLQKAVTLLKEVDIISGRPLITRQIDRTVLNVQGNVLSAGDNMIDVLRMGPGIVVDERDQLTLNGKSVTILVNGRPLPVGKEALSTYLKSLSANKIDKIELISNPTAQFEAGSGNAIINIIPMAIKENGLKGTLIGGYTYSKLNTANLFAAATYKANKLVFDLNFSTVTEGSLETSDKEQHIYSGSQINTDVHDHKRKKLFISSFGINYDLYPGTFIGGVVNLTKLNMDQKTESSTFISNISGDSLSILNDRAKNKNNVSAGNLYFHHELKNHGVLEAKADFWEDDRNQERGLGSYTNNVLHDTLRYNSIDRVKNYSAKVDLSLPGKNGGMFKSGIRSSLNDIFYNNNYMIFLTRLPDFNGGEFNYSEWINAAYVDHTFRKFGKWTIESGLRLESTRTRSSSSVSEKSPSMDYINFFPSLIIQRAIKSEVLNNVNVSYSRKVTRPRYSYLNTVPLFQTSYSYVRGNPVLKPGYSDQVEGSLTFFKKYMLNLNYTRNTGGISNNLLTNDLITVTTYSNLSKSKSYTLILNTPVDIQKFHLNSSLRVSYIKQHTEIDSLPVIGSQFNWSINVSASYVFPREMVLRANGFYVSPNINGQMAYEARQNLSLSLSKIWKKKYVVNIRLDDPFYINKENYSILSKYQRSTYHSQWNSRTFGISFTYLFESGKTFNARRQDRGNNEDVGRRN